jgi:thioesterase domain-containing protein
MFILIPGSGGNAWYWHRLVPLLKSAEHAVIAIELPAADDTKHLSDYVASAIEQATRHAAAQRPLTVVGQSMAGFVAPSVAVELAADRLVLLNAMTPLAG